MTWHGRRTWRLLTLLALLALAAAPLRAQTEPCPPQPDLMPEPEHLSHAGSLLRPDGRIDMLVVGSASVLGPEASLRPGTVTSLAVGAGTPVRTSPATSSISSEASFPVQMVHELERLLPGLHVRLTVRGGRGLTASEMLSVMRDALAKNPAQLVLWQTGTIEAVRSMTPGPFLLTLQDGAELATESGADLVLISPQFSRFLTANADLDPYLTAMEQTAALPDVVLFPRYALMQAWSESGGLDLESASEQTRQAVAVQLHACLGRTLAAMLVADSQVPP